MLRTLVGAFDRAAASIACALVVALLGCVTLGVVTRAFGEPLIWTDEGSRFLMVWLAVFGWLLASRKRIHVRIRYFQELLPAISQRGLEVAFQLALVGLGALIAGFGVALVARNRDLEATSLPISMAWMYVPMVLAGIVTLLQAAHEVVEALRGRGPAATAAPAETEVE
ncbi:MAG TPA: TRAP transporter small permease [Casimicrobiaceae bacterium]|jgi:TRAP-type C4-dicarboxylate transport system permease small subunit|nr:TRAP transporter small permease [Casimicrobiaceae bacterium]